MPVRNKLVDPFPEALYEAANDLGAGLPLSTGPDIIDGTPILNIVLYSEAEKEIFIDRLRKLPLNAPLRNVPMKVSVGDMPIFC